MIESDWLKKWSRFSPHSIAFKDADGTQREYSYAALYFLSCRLGQELRDKHGVHTGDRVALLATNEIETVVLFFAIQRIGAILIPINYRLTAREISHVLVDSDATLLIAQSQFNATIAQASGVPKKTWAFDGAASLSASIAHEFEVFTQERIVDRVRHVGQAWVEPFAGSFEDTCMILYTSGTTGAPKGAMISNRMLYWNSINTTLRLDLGKHEVGLSFLPFFHTGGWNVLLTPFVHRGAKTIVMKKFDAERVLELCDSEKVTVLFGVPTTMDMLSRSPRFESSDFSSLRFAIVGGEPMPIELIRTWQNKGVAVRQGFGLTEFGPNVFSLNEEDAIRKIGSIGFPNFYIETRVVNDAGDDVENGDVGELLLRGPVCTPGYWRNDAATAATIQDGWLKTGDLVRQDDEGYFYVAGRKKDMFISGGENVYPIEVERCLSQHPAIREVAIIGVPDERWGEVGKAFISIKTGASLTENEVLAFCRENLAKFKIPKHIEFRLELPKGDSGKILKRLL